MAVDFGCARNMGPDREREGCAGQRTVLEVRKGVARRRDRNAGGWKARVVGVFSDYGNPRGEIIIGLDALVQHYPDVEKLRYGLRMEPQEIAGFRQRLMTEFGLPEANIVDRVSLKRQSAAIFEQTFAVTGALNVLTLAVAGFAMFSSQLTLASLRLPQLAPVWARTSSPRPCDAGSSANSCVMACDLHCRHPCRAGTGTGFAGNHQCGGFRMATAADPVSAGLAEAGSCCAVRRHHFGPDPCSKAC